MIKQIGKKIKRYSAEGVLFSRILKMIKKKIVKFFSDIDKGVGFVARKIIFKNGEVQGNKIFFMTYDNAYTCNPRYIAEECIRRKLPVEIVWVVSKKAKMPQDRFPKEIKLVRRGSYEMFQEQASAKIWIDNALNCVWFGMPKKKGQIYINTWHGSMGIKRLSGNRMWMQRAKACNAMTDYCISNSAFEEAVYRETFWKGTPILKYGHARNDVFFDKAKCEKLKAHAVEYFDVCADVKLFLYAPTFRDNGATDYEAVDYEALRIALEKRFGGKWIILVRPHFKDRARKKDIVVSEWLKDASDYGDMQELLPAIDAGMTDYSSWAYDFILTRRPLLFYAPDEVEYDQVRGFYFTLKSTNFPLAHNNQELLDAIRAFDEATY